MAAGGVYIPNPPSYKLQRKLGQGGFGTVYKAKNQSSGQICALKVIDISQMSSYKRASSRDEWKKESDTLLKVSSHPNIVDYRKSFDTGDKLWLEMEFCSGGDMQSYYWKNGIGRPLKRQFMIEISSAVAFLHRKDIVHRDLKPQNILVAETGGVPHAKVSDFGLAKAIASSRYDGNLSAYYMDAGAGTKYFMAPEVYLETYTYKADIFAMAVLFSALITESTIDGKYLAGYVKDEDGVIWPDGEYMSIQKCDLVINPTLKVGANLFELLKSMFQYDHHKRPTAEQVNQQLKNSISAGDFDDDPTSRPFP